MQKRPMFTVAQWATKMSSPSSSCRSPTMSMEFEDVRPCEVYRRGNRGIYRERQNTENNVRIQPDEYPKKI